MSESSSYIAIVPARSGSKGIPGKNLVKLGGRSLLAWSIQAARQSMLFEDIIISSDDNEYLKEGAKAGATICIKRPKSLATDLTKQIEVLNHAIEELRVIGKFCTQLVLLQPTCPFRRPQDLVRAVALHKEYPRATLISVCNISGIHPSTIYRGTLPSLQAPSVSNVDAKGTLRQNFESIFWRNGAIYILNKADLEKGNLYSDDIIGIEMSSEASINIDESKDLLEARNFLTSDMGKEIFNQLWGNVAISDDN